MPFLILILSIVAVPSVASAQPAIHFDVVSHNLGVVNADEPVEYVFDFENRGTEELVINRLKAS